jgi:uncharacterized membrane protein
MTFDAINRTAVVTTTLLLGVGLALHVGRVAAAAAVLDAGLIALMLTPVLRLATTLVTDARRRDLVAMATTVAVAVILGVALVLAMRP